MHLTDHITQTIQSAIPDALIYILDPHNDGVHLQGLVISASFKNLSLVKQQQLVMNSLKKEFSSSLHALGLKTFTFEDWETNKHKYIQE